MDVPLIEMDPQEAKERLGEYETLLRGRAMSRANSDIAQELRAAASGFRALAAGTQVISLIEAFEHAIPDARGRPNLAVGRSDRKQVCLYFHGWGRNMWFSTHDRGAINPGWDAYTGSLDIRIPTKERWEGAMGYALVPMVTPLGIQAAGGLSTLKNHLTLWEVEDWSDNPINALPDLDPMLLKPLGGDLYAVVHSWDLTDLERTIMEGRSRI